DGRIGWGEAATSWRVTGESPESVAAVVAGPLSDAVRGRSIAVSEASAALRAAARGTSAARSAVECALIDLDAQAREMPLARALGADATAVRIRTDMTLSAGLPAELAARAAEHVSDGFRCLKIKASADMDTLAAVRAVRAAVGPTVT